MIRGLQGKRCIIVLLLLAGLLLNACDSSIPLQLNLAPARAKAQHCVEPNANIRRKHAQYLNQHRAATVIHGIRTQKYSLNACINCHIDPTRQDGSAIHYADNDHFCTSCHRYVGVVLDCFQCHADRPAAKNEHYQHKLSISNGTLKHGQSKALSQQDTTYVGVFTKR